MKIKNKVTWQEFVLHSAVEAAQDDRLVSEGWNSSHVTLSYITSTAVSIFNCVLLVSKN